MSYPGEVGTIYLLHFDEPFGKPDRNRRARDRGPRKQKIADWTPAGHYIGWAMDLDERLQHHAAGTGAVLPGHVAAKAAAAGAEGPGWVVARLWAGTRDKERQLKNQGGASRLCPVCRGRSDGSEPEIDLVSKAQFAEMAVAA